MGFYLKFSRHLVNVIDIVLLEKVVSVTGFADILENSGKRASRQGALYIRPNVRD